MTKGFKRPTRAHVISLVKHYCIAADVPELDLWGKQRYRAVCWVRWSVCQELRRDGYSLPGIASVLGINHSTVFYAEHKGDLGLPPKMSKSAAKACRARAAAIAAGRG